MRVRTEKEYVKEINNRSTKRKICARSSLEYSKLVPALLVSVCVKVDEGTHTETRSAGDEFENTLVHRYTKLSLHIRSQTHTVKEYVSSISSSEELISENSYCKCDVPFSRKILSAMAVCVAVSIVENRKDF